MIHPTPAIETHPLPDSPVFQHLSHDEIQDMLGVWQNEQLRSGAFYCAEGDAGDALALVAHGRVSVFASIQGGGRRHLCELGPGGVFGEMSFLDGSPRSASVQCLEDTVLWTLTPPSFAGYSVGNPHASAKFYGNLARILATRVRDTTDELRERTEWSLRVSGAAAAGLNMLIRDGSALEVFVEQVGSLRAQLLQVTKTDLGPQLLMGDATGSLWLIPYHAVRALRWAEASRSAAIIPAAPA